MPTPSPRLLRRAAAPAVLVVLAAAAGALPLHAQSLSDAVGASAPPIRAVAPPDAGSRRERPRRDSAVTRRGDGDGERSARATRRHPALPDSFAAPAARAVPASINRRLAPSASHVRSALPARPLPTAAPASASVTAGSADAPTITPAPVPMSARVAPPLRAAKATPPRAALPSRAAPNGGLDALTRDGGTPAAASGSGAGVIDEAQGMSVGWAVLRTLVALGGVLALTVAALRFLKARGYGVLRDGARPGAVGAPGAPTRKAAVLSALAEAIAARNAAGSAASVGPSDESERAAPQAVWEHKPAAPARGLAGDEEATLDWTVRRRAASDIAAAAAGQRRSIDDFEFLGNQPLPGAGHTLYKVRVGDRLLLLGGAPHGALNVLTEWDVEPDAAHAASGRFEEALRRAPSYRASELEREESVLDAAGASVGVFSAEGVPAGDSGMNAGRYDYGQADPSAQAAALRGATRRLGDAVKRAAAAASGGYEAQIDAASHAPAA